MYKEKGEKIMKTIDLKNLRITVEHFVSLPLTVTDYICEVVDKLGPAGAYIKPGIVDTNERKEIATSSSWNITANLETTWKKKGILSL